MPAAPRPALRRFHSSGLWRRVQVEDEEQWLLRTATEIDNLRAAVLWSLDSDGRRATASLALHIIAEVTASSFEDWSGVWTWAELAVERAGAREPVLRSTVLAVASSSAFYRADYVTAHQLAREALRDGVAADSPAPELPYMALMISSRPQRIQRHPGRGAGRRRRGRRQALFTRETALARRPDAPPRPVIWSSLPPRRRKPCGIGQQLNRRSVITLGLYLVALTTWRSAPDDALAALEASRIPTDFSATMRGRALALAAQLRAAKGRRRWRHIGAEGGDSSDPPLRRADGHRDNIRPRDPSAHTPRALRVGGGLRRHRDRRRLREHVSACPSTSYRIVNARSSSCEENSARTVRRGHRTRGVDELRRGAKLDDTRARRPSVLTRRRRTRPEALPDR